MKKENCYSKWGLVGLIVLFPGSALAAAATNSFYDLMQYFISVLGKQVLPLLIGLAILFLMWGIFRYITSGGDEVKRRESLGLMMYGVFAIFITVSLWGFVNLLVDSLFTSSDIQPDPSEYYQLPIK